MVIIIKKPVVKKSPIFLIILLLVVVLIRLSLPHLGRMLVAEDKPLPSDVIVLLMGSETERMPGAVELYQAGYADTILMVRNKMAGFDELSQKGVKIPHDTERAKMIGMQMGLPEDAFIILPGEAESTQDEAVTVRNYLRDRPEVESLLLVTSRYHSGRAKRIFTKATRSLPGHIRVLSCPTRQDSFNEDKWWQDREDSRRVVLEYAKLANFYLREQFLLRE